MLSVRTAILALGLLFLQTVTAQVVAPAPTLTVTKTVTASKCPGTSCRKICATPTMNDPPSETCTGFGMAECPIALCLSVPAITSTSTKYCRDGGCATVQSTSCQKIPTVTLVPPCPTKCPELCPMPITVVAVACTTASAAA